MAENFFRHLQPGDPAPSFKQQTSGGTMNSDYAGGKYALYCLYGRSSDERGRSMLSILEKAGDLFDGAKVAFYGVSVDPRDRSVKEQPPRIVQIMDMDLTVSRLFGSVPENATGSQISLRRHWLVLDPSLRVRAVFQTEPDGAEIDKIIAYLKRLPPVNEYPGLPVTTPIIILPEVFEPEFCRSLIELYESNGGRETGFMRDVDGKTVEILDHKHKQRSDFHVDDEKLQEAIQKRIMRRVMPEIKKVHQFDVTRMERFLIGCYDGETGGHFSAHRDNTTLGTAHRRFAVSVNLNDDFSGGEVGFPEYGTRTFKAPAGGAVVFSCSLLHRVTKVTQGKRYAFLPFLYDEAGADIRRQNRQFLAKRPPEEAAAAS